VGSDLLFWKREKNKNFFWFSWKLTEYIKKLLFLFDNISFAEGFNILFLNGSKVVQVLSFRFFIKRRSRHILLFFLKNSRHFCRHLQWWFFGEPEFFYRNFWPLPPIPSFKNSNLLSMAISAHFMLDEREWFLKEKFKVVVANLA
jgi:hypothetical protein